MHNHVAPFLSVDSDVRGKIYQTEKRDIEYNAYWSWEFETSVFNPYQPYHKSMEGQTDKISSKVEAQFIVENVDKKSRKIFNITICLLKFHYLTLPQHNCRTDKVIR